MATINDEYTKLKLIGRGSFAAVYKVRHNKLGYVRAIKVSNEQIESENDKAYQSFLNECRLLLQIGNGSHPNIVHIYQPRLMDGQVLVEMDYIDGVPLTDYIREHKFVEMSEFWQFADQILSAVGYCHADLYKFLMSPDQDNLESDPDDGSKFLITPEKVRQLQAKYCVNHNDLHSHNIMRRNYDGSYILLDFGLAIQSEQCVKSSSRGAGAHEYSSPEKLSGESITACSDVYSLGILMYEMLAGRVPFVLANSGSIAEVSRLLDRHLHETPTPIEPLRKAAFEATHPGETYVKDYPDELEQVIMRCLMKKPADRYANAKVAHEALDAAKARATVSTGGSSDSISTLKAEIARLTAENSDLRAQLATLTTVSGGTSKHHEAEPAYRIGQMLESGRVCYVDPSGQHGLVIATQSIYPMRWLRHVDEEDYEMFTYQSKAWYKENCFIVPRGTHLPTETELRNIMPNAGNLGLSVPVWTWSNEVPCSFDLRSGSISDLPASGNIFIALKAF